MPECLLLMARECAGALPAGLDDLQVPYQPHKRVYRRETRHADVT